MITNLSGINWPVLRRMLRDAIWARRAAAAVLREIRAIETEAGE